MKWRFEKALTPPDFHNALGVADLHPTLTPTQGFGVEFFATFTLVLVVFSVCDENRTDLKGSAPLIIGLYVTAAILATVISSNPLTHGSHASPAVRSSLDDVFCSEITQ